MIIKIFHYSPASALNIENLILFFNHFCKNNFMQMQVLVLHFFSPKKSFITNPQKQGIILFYKNFRTIYYVVLIIKNEKKPNRKQPTHRIFYATCENDIGKIIPAVVVVATQLVTAATWEVWGRDGAGGHLRLPSVWEHWVPLQKKKLMKVPVKIFFSEKKCMLNPKYIWRKKNRSAYSYLRTCRPHPPFKSVPYQRVIVMVRSVLNRTGKIIEKFSDFYFWVIIENWGDFFGKMTLKWSELEK